MAVSQNGWSANDRSVIETYTVGARTRVPLRKGDAGFLLKHFADWFDANIRDIDENYNRGQLDDWGYAERPIRGGTTLSNHASGTAIDINATCWPLGKDESIYLSPQEIAKVREQLRVYEGAIRWGGDYTGRQDPMHFEIDKDAAFVARIAAKLRGAPAPTPPGPVGSEDIKWTQQRLSYWGFDPGPHDGILGDRTKNAILTFQKAKGLAADGIVGPKTRAALAENKEPWLALADVRATPRKFQQWYNAYPFRPALLPIIKPLADSFGPQSLAALKKVQARYGLAADGIVGPKTKKLLWDLGWRG